MNREQIVKLGLGIIKDCKQEVIRDRLDLVAEKDT